MANTYTDQFKYRMPALGDLGWDDEVNDNVIINDFALTPIIKGNRVVSGCAPTDGGGLDIDVAAGTVVVAGTQYTISADTKTCSGSDKNYLFIDDSGDLYCTTTQPTGDYVALAMIDAGAASLDRFSDVRAMAQGAQALAIDYTPTNYDLDTSEDEDINQHLSGIDKAIAFNSGFNNKIINGRFKFLRYAASQTSSGYYSLQRFSFNHSGSSKTVSQQAFTVGQTDVPNNPENYCRTVFVTASNASDYVQTQQRIESVLSYAGEQCLFEMWAKADSPKNIALELLQFFGTGGSSTITGIGINTFSLTTSWDYYSAIIDVPSISGKTIGSSKDDYLAVNLWKEAGSDYNSRTNSLGNQSGTIDIAEWQLRPINTNWEYRPTETEKRLCERFFETSYSEGVLPGTATFPGAYEAYLNGLASNTYSTNISVSMRTLKRSTPSVGVYSPQTGTAGYLYDAALNGDVASAGINAANNKYFSIIGTAGSVSTYLYLIAHWVTSSEL